MWPEWNNASVIMGLPAIEAGETCEVDGVYNHVSNQMSELNIERIQYIREHGAAGPSCLQSFDDNYIF